MNGNSQLQPIVIIAAMPMEIELLEQSLGHTVTIAARGFQCCEGAIGSVPVIICAGGVGKINAAATAAVMVERYQPQLVINTGCAGAYLGSGLATGDLVVASEEVLADDGVFVADGWKDLRYMNLPSIEHGGVSRYNILPLSRHASERAMRLAGYFGVSLTRGRFATVSTCSGTSLHGSKLANRWNALVENMEGAAVAQVCLRYETACLEIRGISNQVDERDLEKWDIPQAVEAAQRFVLKYIEDMNRSNLAAVFRGDQEV